uniref:B3 domain-containing protein n=1 Tax=Vitis vinifera TaxID=29760 RepID=A5BN41_VITVI|nr:hypothetical protein VITISV_030556 [Vitis vinifera]
MEKTTFHHFLLTKVEEEEEIKRYGCSPHERRWEIVEKRVEPPKLLQLFPWEINKVLNANDVSSLGALELTPEQVHNHIFKYWEANMVAKVLNSEQVPIVIIDVDTNTKHSLFFKKWSQDENFIIHSSWMNDFVRRRDLQEGMLIGMYWDIRSSSFKFSILNNHIVD